MRHYATQFGLGELAGYTLQASSLASIPTKPLPHQQGGVGRMCSFGQGVSMTPLQLGAFVAAMANGGTLYYLQHPTTPEEVATFQPQRQADSRYRSATCPRCRTAWPAPSSTEPHAACAPTSTKLPVFGKTGTCSDKGTRFGWFASYSEAPQGSLVTVFFLEGGRPTFGPRAAELTGEFYKNLWDRNYFAEKGSQQAHAGLELTGTATTR